MKGMPEGTSIIRIFACVWTQVASAHRMGGEIHLCSADKNRDQLQLVWIQFHENRPDKSHTHTRHVTRAIFEVTLSV